MNSITRNWHTQPIAHTKHTGGSHALRRAYRWLCVYRLRRLERDELREERQDQCSEIVTESLWPTRDPGRWRLRPRYDGQPRDETGVWGRAHIGVEDGAVALPTATARTEPLFHPRPHTEIRSQRARCTFQGHCRRPRARCRPNVANSFSGGEYAFSTYISFSSNFQIQNIFFIIYLKKLLRAVVPLTLRNGFSKT